MHKKDLDEKSLVELTEKILKNRVDIKYYRAIITLLEKGYLLNDISAALLMSISENKASATPVKKEQERKKLPPQNKSAAKKETEKTVKKQDKQAKNTQKKKALNTGKKNSQMQKKKSFRPAVRKVKNESSNS